MPEIRLKNINKTIEGKGILKNICLRIEDGLFTCILGPPGAGKTTLLKIIAGLESLATGEVYFGEENITDLSPQMRDISMVFQDFALYPHLLVYENIASPLKAKRMPKKEIRKKVKEVTSFLGIDRLLDRIPRQLSGGEMQRVAIARAMIKEPKVYLLDEILVNLDYKIREEMRSELKGIAKKMGRTIIYATPDPLDVLSMADRVVVLHKGIIEQKGSTKEVYTHPKNIVVGGYFGFPEMNLVDCVLKRKNNKLFITTDELTIDISEFKEKLKERKEKEVILGVRPENMNIATEAVQKRGNNLVKGEVVLGEVIGSDTIVHVKIGKDKIKIFVPRIYRVPIGEKIWLHFNTRDIYLFNRQTGECILG